MVIRWKQCGVMIDNEVADEVLHGYSEPIMLSIVNIDNIRSTLDDIDWIGAVGFDKIPPKVLKILHNKFFNQLRISSSSL